MGMNTFEIKHYCLNKAFETFETFGAEGAVIRDIVTLAKLYEMYLTDDPELDQIYEED